MTSKKFAHKRIGFLAASQSFHDSTDVLMLTTNMLKKVFVVVFAVVAVVVVVVVVVGSCMHTVRGKRR